MVKSTDYYNAHSQAHGTSTTTTKSSPQL